MAPKTTASGSTDKSGPVVTTDSPAEDSSATSPEHRAEVASKLVDRFALWAGAAGLVPVPVLDAVAVAGIQLQMLRRLSQIFDVPFTENRGKSLLAALAGAAIPASSGIGATSLLKSIPVIGTAIGSLVMPTLSAGATYAIGKVFIQHFQSGGTLLDFNPPDYKEFIKSQKELWSTRAAAKATDAEHTASSSSQPSKGAATASP
jgi:uncharacterized protein (DUF697 family)